MDITRVEILSRQTTNWTATDFLFFLFNYHHSPLVKTSNVCVHWRLILSSFLWQCVAVGCRSATSSRGPRWAHCCRWRIGCNGSLRALKPCDPEEASLLHQQTVCTGSCSHFHHPLWCNQPGHITSPRQHNHSQMRSLMITWRWIQLPICLSSVAARSLPSQIHFVVFRWRELFALEPALGRCALRLPPLNRCSRRGLLMRWTAFLLFLCHPFLCVQVCSALSYSQQLLNVFGESWSGKVDFAFFSIPSHKPETEKKTLSIKLWSHASSLLRHIRAQSTKLNGWLDGKREEWG